SLILRFFPVLFVVFFVLIATGGAERRVVPVFLSAASLDVKFINFDFFQSVSFQFFSIVLIIFIIEVAGAIVLLVPKLLEGLEDEVRKDITEKYGTDESATQIWNNTMEQFECCGFMNYTDFDQSPFVTTRNTYPTACCNATEIQQGECSKTGAMTSMVPGCYWKLLDFIKENAVIVAGVALGVAALEVKISKRKCRKMSRDRKIINI
uniref:Tetraspanin n=1 Tax=Periophthalmus magnuspinnatus TaxID=409849 RepID=A0A3B3ZUR7_9GOBI